MQFCYPTDSHPRRPEVGLKVYTIALKAVKVELLDTDLARSWLDCKTPEHLTLNILGLSRA